MAATPFSLNGIISYFTAGYKYNFNGNVKSEYYPKNDFHFVHFPVQKESPTAYQSCKASDFRGDSYFNIPGLKFQFTDYSASSTLARTANREKSSTSNSIVCFSKSTAVGSMISQLFNSLL